MMMSSSHCEVIVEGFAHFKSPIISQVHFIPSCCLKPMSPSVGLGLKALLLPIGVGDSGGVLADPIGVEARVLGDRVPVVQLVNLV